MRVEGRFVRQTGGRGQYGHVWLELAPNEPGAGFVFEDKIVGGSVPRNISNLWRRASSKRWIAACWLATRLWMSRSRWWMARYHEVDSSEMAFKIAGSMAFKDGAQKAGPILLEPMMRVETVVPDEFVGDVVGDFSSRRGAGRGHGIPLRWRPGCARAVPLSEMFGYATDLRSMTSGRATSPWSSRSTCR